VAPQTLLLHMDSDGASQGVNELRPSREKRLGRNQSESHHVLGEGRVTEHQLRVSRAAAIRCE
jgi:hypothetical protein